MIAGMTVLLTVYVKDRTRWLQKHAFDLIRIKEQVLAPLQPSFLLCQTDLWESVLPSEL